MCEICGREICPPRCPNYEESRVARCAGCGVRLLEGDGYYETNGKPYCEECINGASLEELVRICETETEEVLGELGLCHRYFDETGG